MLIKLIIRRGLLTRTFLKQCNCSHGLEKRGSSIRLWIRASKLLSSARLTKPQSRTLAKNLIIQGLIQTIAVVESRARTRSTTRLFRKSKIGRLTHKSGN
jgi:hypothetical protein